MHYEIIPESFRVKLIQLPAVWGRLIQQLETDGHHWHYPSLERYGDWNEDPQLLQTELMIGMAK